MARALFVSIAWVVLATVAMACDENTTEPHPAAVATVEITPSAVSVDEGDTVRLSVRVADREDTELTGRAVAWASLDPATAT
ncbi:MAG: hypothetical protein HKO53_09075, partial [Gemmatimonadetes bacterium]|nr:hypothetical protein [Gemmatimonadota bacterium]